MSLGSKTIDTYPDGVGLNTFVLMFWHIQHGIYIQRYGCAKKGSAKLLARIESLMETIPVLPLNIPADAEYGGIRAALETGGEPIGANDLLIGAHAYALGMTLVTGNTREFERIPGLAVENWLI